LFLPSSLRKRYVADGDEHRSRIAHAPLEVAEVDCMPPTAGA